MSADAVNLHLLITVLCLLGCCSGSLIIKTTQRMLILQSPMHTVSDVRLLLRKYFKKAEIIVSIAGRRKHVLMFSNPLLNLHEYKSVLSIHSAYCNGK